MDSVNALIYDTLMSIPQIEFIEDNPLTFQLQEHQLLFKQVELKNSISDNISNYANLYFMVEFDQQQYTYHFHGKLEDLSDSLLSFVLHYVNPLELQNVYEFLSEKKELINSIDYLSDEKQLLINETYLIGLLGSFEQKIYIKDYQVNTSNRPKTITTILFEMIDEVPVFFDTEKLNYEPCLELFFKNQILPKQETLMNAYRKVEKERLNTLLSQEENNNNKKIKL